MQKEWSDGDLIKNFVHKGDNKAFEALMRRHYDMSYKRFLKHCRDPHIAEDLTQSLWENQVKNLKNYQDQGKYPNFLMNCISNLLIDHWRRKGVKDRVIEHKYDDSNDLIESALDNRSDTLQSNELQQQINYLTNKLIPALPCDQRLVFLLKHESEYWEDKQRLEWQHLAQLNNIDAESAWQNFEQYRNSMLAKTNGADVDVCPSCENNLLFLVWTQAQRHSKNQDYTWQYFSKILNLSENTLKTRYRAALKSLAKSLSEFHEPSIHQST